MRRLRERNEPVRLYAESDNEAFQRLKKVEMLIPEINKVCACVTCVCCIVVCCIVVKFITQSCHHETCIGIFQFSNFQHNDVSITQNVFVFSFKLVRQQQNYHQVEDNMMEYYVS